MLVEKWNENLRQQFLLSSLACPGCRSPISSPAGMDPHCLDCGRFYPRRNGALTLASSEDRLKTQVRAAEHYHHGYTSLQTFGDQWIAADLILKGDPATVLEIGVGQQVLSHYLSFLGEIGR